MFHIRSTYAEWAPEFDDYPEGRDWPGEFATFRTAWSAVRSYLLQEKRWHQVEGGWLAPFGQEEGLAFHTHATIRNDAETIRITQTR